MTCLSITYLQVVILYGPPLNQSGEALLPLSKILGTDLESNSSGHLQGSSPHLISGMGIWVDGQSVIDTLWKCKHIIVGLAGLEFGAYMRLEIWPFQQFYP